MKLYDFINDGKLHSSVEILRTIPVDFENEIELPEDIKVFKRNFVTTGLIHFNEMYYVKRFEGAKNIFTEKDTSNLNLNGLSGEELRTLWENNYYEHPMCKDEFLKFVTAADFIKGNSLDDLEFRLLMQEFSEKYLNGENAITTDEAYTLIPTDGGFDLIPVGLYEDNLNLVKDIQAMLTYGGSFLGSEIYMAYNVYKKRRKYHDEVIEQFAEIFLQGSRKISEDIYYIVNVNDPICIVKRDLSYALTGEQAKRELKKLEGSGKSVTGAEIKDLVNTLVRENLNPLTMRSFEEILEFKEVYIDGEFPLSNKARYYFGYSALCGYSVKRDTARTPRKEVQE